MSSRHPVVDVESRPYWDGLKQRQLRVQRCQDCSRHYFYPRVACPHCHSLAVEWVEAEGTGTVYSFTVSRRAASPDFADRVPYVVALVDLNEGFRMMANVTVADIADIAIGDTVRVAFEDIDETTTVPYFVLAPDQNKASQCSSMEKEDS